MDKIEILCLVKEAHSQEGVMQFVCQFPVNGIEIILDVSFTLGVRIPRFLSACEFTVVSFPCTRQV